jgi:tetratricopeptide (TPR) repeat protein
VLHVLGMPSELDRLDTAGATDRLAGILADMMRRHAQTRLTVLWFDNLQWAQPTVRRLLAVVVRSLLDLPFLLITAQRPDDAEQWPPAELDRPLVVRLPLGPLGPTDAKALVRHVLEADGEASGIDDGQVEILAERGGGNPLFLVELAAVCADGRADVALSGNLRALIAARLDQLPPTQRAIVDNAAVLGTSDVVKALEHFAQELGQPFRAEDVAALAADGVFEVQDGRWRFASEVVREVAYQTLTKRTRAARHAGVAAALREMNQPHREHLAHHTATAAELVAELGPVTGVPDSIVEDAVNDLLASATIALAEGRAPAATRHATRALDLGVADPVIEQQLLVVRASSDLEQRRFPEAERDARAALQLALAAGDHAAEAEARLRLGTAAHYLGDLVTARAELDQAVATWRQADDQERLAEGLRARGFAEVFGGSLPSARRFLDEAMELFHASDNERGHAWTHHNLAWVAFQAGDVVDAERQLAEARERFEALGDRVGVNWANGLLAYVTYFQRRFDEAEALATSVEVEARRWGDTWARLMMQTLIANLRLWSGRLHEAETMASRALIGFREAGDRYGLMQALAPLTRVRAALGKAAEAERGSEELVSLGHSFGELGLALQGAAGVAVHLGDAERALVLTEQVLDRQRATGAATAEAMVLRSLALAQLGQIDAAIASIDTVEVTDFPFGQAARALVRSLAGDPAGSEDARTVLSGRSPTYFDRALALLAVAMAPADPVDPGRREQARQELRSLAHQVGDAAFIGVSDALAGAAPPSTSLGESPIRDGWQRMVAARLALG